MTAILIDDSEFMRTLLKSIIEKKQVTVVGEGNNGLKAIDLYKEKKPDIVFMDVMMDDIDGIEAFKQIKQFDTDARIVMVSSMMTQKPFVDDVLELGATAIINKPFDEKEITSVLTLVKSLMNKE